MALIGRTELARIFKVSEHHINALAKEGLPQKSRGRYDVGECLLWYLRYLKSKLRERRYPLDEELASTERAERLRLVRAEAGLKELELARERGEFMAVAEFEKFVTEMVVTTKARLLALPSRVAAQLVGEDRRAIEDLLGRELREALSSLKNGFEKHAPANRPAAKIISEGSNGRNGKSEISNCESREVRVLPGLR